MYLGIQAVIAISFARIHRANLINFGILPLLFKREEDYERLEQGDRLLIRNVRDSIEEGKDIIIENISKGYTFEARANLNRKERELILMGGLLPLIRYKRTGSNLSP